MKLISKISIAFLLLTATIACKDTKNEVDPAEKAATEKIEAVGAELETAAKELEKEAKELDDALKALDDI